MYSPYYGAAFVSDFLGIYGVKVAALDNGTGAVATYVIYSVMGSPLRLLVLNLRLVLLPVLVLVARPPRCGPARFTHRRTARLLRRLVREPQLLLPLPVVVRPEDRRERARLPCVRLLRLARRRRGR